MRYSAFFFFVVKQKTAYEMRISDWSSDVCSSDLPREIVEHERGAGRAKNIGTERIELRADEHRYIALQHRTPQVGSELGDDQTLFAKRGAGVAADRQRRGRVVVALARIIKIDRPDFRRLGRWRRKGQ